MAFTTASQTADRSGTTFFAALWSGFAAIGNWLISISESTHRARQVEALFEKSDEQLAQMGLKREDIVRHVYRDMYYI